MKWEGSCPGIVSVITDKSYLDKELNIPTLFLFASLYNKLHHSVVGGYYIPAYGLQLIHHRVVHMCSTETILTIHHQLKSNLRSLLLLLIQSCIGVTVLPSFFPPFTPSLPPENISQSPLKIDLIGRSFLENRDGTQNNKNLASFAKQINRHKLDITVVTIATNEIAGLPISQWIKF